MVLRSDVCKRIIFSIRSCDSMCCVRFLLSNFSITLMKSKITTKSHLDPEDKNLYVTQLLRDSFVTEAKRLEIDVASLLKSPQIRYVIANANRIARLNEDYVRSHIAIDVLVAFLKHHPPVYSRIPIDYSAGAQASLLFDLATWLYWSCFGRCDFAVSEMSRTV